MRKCIKGLQHHEGWEPLLSIVPLLPEQNNHRQLFWNLIKTYKRTIAQIPGAIRSTLGWLFKTSLTYTCTVITHMSQWSIPERMVYMVCCNCCCCFFQTSCWEPSHLYLTSILLSLIKTEFFFVQNVCPRQREGFLWDDGCKLVPIKEEALHWNLNF